MKFNCDCGFHQIEIDVDKSSIGKKFDIISIAIYNNRSEQTGKFYKKPKLLGDVVLIREETKKFKKFVLENLKDKKPEDMEFGKKK